MTDNNCMTVPLAALSMDDMGAEPSADHSAPGNIDAAAPQKVAPAIGDPVEFSVSGTVDSIDGDQAHIRVESVNGEPTAAPGQPEPAADDMAGQENKIRKMASAADMAGATNSKLQTPNFK